MFYTSWPKIVWSRSHRPKTQNGETRKHEGARYCTVNKRKRFWKKMMIQKPFSYECLVKSKRARMPKNFKVCIYRNIIETLLCLAMCLHINISMKITLKKKLCVLISDEKVFKFWRACHNVLMIKPLVICFLMTCRYMLKIENKFCGYIYCKPSQDNTHPPGQPRGLTACGTCWVQPWFLQKCVRFYLLSCF